VCGDQVALYNELLPEFRKLGAELVGISVDGAWCHLAFSKDRKLRYPLLSDFEPHERAPRKEPIVCPLLPLRASTPPLLQCA
jgi:peroxiredoxin